MNGARSLQATQPRTRVFAAATIRAPGRVRLERREAPPPGPGEVRVRLEGCGVCGSNLPVWEGRSWFEYPLPPGAPGHEAWGRIEEVGHAVDGIKLGQRVALLSHNAFAEVDTALADAVVPLPPELDGMPFPGEALGCALNVFRRSRIHNGDRVAVVGVGFLGALITQLAARAGARVVTLSRRPFALEVGRLMGAEEVVSLDEGSAAKARVAEWSGEGLCDVVVEATGLQRPLDVASDLVRVRGTLVIAGYHQDGPRQVDLQLWNWRGLDVVNAHEREPAACVRGIEAAAEAVRTGLMDPAPLFTHVFTLDCLDEAFEAARTRPDGFLKALVLP